MTKTTMDAKDQTGTGKAKDAKATGQAATDSIKKEAMALKDKILGMFKKPAQRG